MTRLKQLTEKLFPADGLGESISLGETAEFIGLQCKEIKRLETFAAEEFKRGRDQGMGEQMEVDAKEIIRLRTIVDQLPKTADGVPIVECEKPVVRTFDGELHDVTGWYLYSDGVWGIRIDTGEGRVTKIAASGEVFSSREVGEAALEESRQNKPGGEE